MQHSTAATTTAYRNKTIEMENMGSRSDKFMNRTDRFVTNLFMNEKPIRCCCFLLSWLYLGFGLECRVCAIRDLLI